MYANRTPVTLSDGGPGLCALDAKSTLVIAKRVVFRRQIDPIFVA
jgi:hypothetical protein